MRFEFRDFRGGVEGAGLDGGFNRIHVRSFAAEGAGSFAESRLCRRVSQLAEGAFSLELTELDYGAVVGVFAAAALGFEVLDLFLIAGSGVEEGAEGEGGSELRLVTAELQ